VCRILSDVKRASLTIFSLASFFSTEESDLKVEGFDFFDRYISWTTITRIDFWNPFYPLWE
jgi:hypothetical protein